MITKFALLTGLILTNTAFATDTVAIHNHLTIAAIDQKKGLFNVRELHDITSPKLDTFCSNSLNVLTESKIPCEISNGA